MKIWGKREILHQRDFKFLNAPQHFERPEMWSYSVTFPNKFRQERRGKQIWNSGRKAKLSNFDPHANKMAKVNSSNSTCDNLDISSQSRPLFAGCLQFDLFIKQISRKTNRYRIFDEPSNKALRVCFPAHLARKPWSFPAFELGPRLESRIFLIFLMFLMR